MIPHFDWESNGIRLTALAVCLFQLRPKGSGTPFAQVIHVPFGVLVSDQPDDVRTDSELEPSRGEIEPLP